MFTASHPAALSLSAQLALIIDGLCGAVAARAARHPVAAPLLVLLWGRLRRLARRFARLAEQAAAGAFPAPRVAGAVRKPRIAGAARWRRFPRGYAWLVKLVPEAASAGSQLQHLLAQPEMAALIASAPQAGRMLGPLGRMLAMGARPKRRQPAKVAAAVVSVAPPRRPVPDHIAKLVPEWARNAWPGHDFAGRDPPGLRKHGALPQTPAKDSRPLQTSSTRCPED